MTDSIALNPESREKAKKSVDNNSSSELAGYAAAATIGAGVGLASAVVGTGIFGGKEEDDTTDTSADPVEKPEVAPAEPIDTPEHIHTPSAPQTPAQQPAAPAQQPTAPAQKPSSPANNGEGEEVLTPENPDEIAEAIIAEEQIDAQDIDAPDVINYEAVDTFYTPEGDTFNVALVHDDEGNRLLLVDVNDDKVYDIITDTNLTPIAPMTAEITVSDAEIALSQPKEYLAYNPEEHTEEFGLDSLDQDLIC